MPSLRKRVSSYLRQLSFHNETRDKRHNVNENSFVTKYLQGQITLREGPPIIYGKTPTDLPNYELGVYETGSGTIVGCYSGPNGGLTTVKRSEKHLSVLDADIDFIDTAVAVEEPAVVLPKKSPQRSRGGQPVDNATMVIKVAGQEYCVTNRTKKHNKSHSLGSISDFDLEIETTKIDREFYNTNNNNNSNNNSDEVPCRNNVLVETNSGGVGGGGNEGETKNGDVAGEKQTNRNLAKSKSEGDPFRHGKRGRIIRVANRPDITRVSGSGDETEVNHGAVDDSALPKEWSRKSDLVYGISDSLYDRNQVTNNKNGDPIADCFGVISRGDSSILAVADGVNWGEKASIAAKSAVHGCLHYLNKTIFSDTTPFESLTVKSDDSDGISEPPLNAHRVANTKEIFVCLLRAFNCAHDLILENKGMLTTLTVAVILPLKPRLRREGEEGPERPTQYVCCVCNVGDTLAYVYSQKYGLRELTKGSHDINCNRDMRDALGALGPVDGINPELSNLTLSVTTLQKGDIVMVASDGMTDNFDPNVCRFTVNTNEPRIHMSSANRVLTKPQEPRRTPSQNAKPPVKPPRRSQHLKNKTTDPQPQGEVEPSTSSSSVEPVENLDPLVAHFVKENAVDSASVKKKPVIVETRASSLRRQASSQNKKETTSSHGGRSTQSTKKSQQQAPPPQQSYKFLRSKTTIEMRSSSATMPPLRQVLRNPDGIPFVTPVQRYELQLLLIEDVLMHGITGRDSPCDTARKLCENLVSFTLSITAAKRRTLEDLELYFDNRNGVMVEVSQQEKKSRRKKGLEKVQNLPGKLDHVTVVAWNVGNFSL